MVKKEQLSSDSNSSESGKKISQKEMQELLIDNFVGLQKAMTNLSIKFESLSEQMRRLLEIFELSAKNFMTQNQDSSSSDNKEVLNKIDSLLEQNKILARGLVLIEEKLKVRPEQMPQMQQVTEAEEYEPSEMPRKQPKPLPRI